MTFERFVDICLNSCKGKIPEDKLYFEYTLYPDMIVASTYKCAIKGSNVKVYIAPDQKVCQYYDKENNFVNLESLSECLDRFIEEG